MSEAKCDVCGHRIDVHRSVGCMVGGCKCQFPYCNQNGELERLRADLAAAHARIERLREALRSLEWAGGTKGDGPDSYCVHCMAFEDEGHVAGCAYAEAIADLGEPPATAKETQHER